MGQPRSNGTMRAESWNRIPLIRMTNISLSPTGKRILAEARGEIFTIPAEKGDVRNLTHSSGSAERDPAWSPDGKYVSYFSS